MLRNLLTGPMQALFAGAAFFSKFRITGNRPANAKPKTPPAQRLDPSAVLARDFPYQVAIPLTLPRQSRILGDIAWAVCRETRSGPYALVAQETDMLYRFTTKAAADVFSKRADEYLNPPVEKPANKPRRKAASA